MTDTTARAMITGAAHREALGKRGRHREIIPKVPTLSRTATRSVVVPGRAVCATVGSHVWSGTIGALIANAKKNATKIEPLRRRAEAEAREVVREEALVSPGAGAVERDDAREHHEPADEREDQELDGGVAALLAPEEPDEEVERDQHRLERDVEQEDVARREDQHHERLEREDQREVLACADRNRSSSFHPARMTSGVSTTDEQDEQRGRCR